MSGRLHPADPSDERCGVSDGSACAIVTTPEMAEKLGKTGHVVSIKPMQLALSNGSESGYDDLDGSYALTTRLAAAHD